MFGLVAMAIPLALHLISKREPRTVAFPAIRFLQQRYQSNRSKLQVRRWWLLALRMLALAALAVTLARPAILRSLSTTWLSIGIVAVFGIVLLSLAAIAYSRGQTKRLVSGLLAAALLTLLVTLLWAGATFARGPAINFEAQAPAAVAIVIDNSPTSLWKVAGRTQLQQHATSAVDLISRLAPASRIAIIDRSALPASFAIDVAAAISKVEALTAREVTLPLGSQIDAALRLVRTSDLENRQVFVLSNLAESTWGTPSSSLQSVIQAEPPVSVTVVNTTTFSGMNRSLSLPKLSDATPPKQTPTPVTLAVSLETAELEGMDSPSMDPVASSAIAVEMMLFKLDALMPIIRDGQIVYPETKIVDRTSTRLMPSQSAEVVLTIPPLSEGTHHALVRLVGDDSLAIDDVRYFTVNVLQPTPLLVVGLVPEETRLISGAITAPFAWDDPNAEFKIDRISYQDLLATRLEAYKACVLLDPPSDVLSEAMLKEYVSRGGGLLVCLGPAATASDSQKTIVGEMVRRWRVPAAGTFLQPARPSHSVLAPLAEISGGVPWNLYPVRQYWQLESDSRSTVLMNYAATDHAALVQRNSTDAPNSGRCLVLTTPVPALSRDTRSWNDLFSSDSWPAFLLVRSAVDYISARGPDTSTTRVGQPQTIKLIDRLDQVAENTETSYKAQLFAPGNPGAIPLIIDPSAENIVVPEVERSGTYWIRGSSFQSGFSANLPVTATAVAQVDTSLLDEWFGSDNYQYVSDTDEIDISHSQESTSVALQSPAMLLALIVFLLEQILSNRFYRSTSSITAMSSVTQSAKTTAA